MLRIDQRLRARFLTTTLFAALAFGAAHSPSVSAQTPDGTALLGTYVGDVQGSAISCLDPADNENFSTNMQISLNEYGSAKGGFITGDGDSGSIRADLLSLNMVSFQASGSSPDGSTFDISGSGSFNEAEGILSLSFGGTDSDGCSLSGNILVTRVTDAPVDTANAASNVVQGEQNAREAANQANTFLSISRQRRQRRGGGEGMMRFGAEGAMVQGEAAGSGDMPIGAWAAYSHTSADNDFAATSFHDSRHDFLFGLDTQMDGGNTLVGVAFGISTGDTTTRYNAGTQNVTAITVAPYVGMLLTDWLSFDATVGYSDVQIDQTRTSPATGTLITSDVDSYRLFGAVNLAATYNVGDLLLTGLGGMTWASQHDDSFRESGGVIVSSQSNKVGRFLLGAEAAYSAGAWEPYARGMFNYDFSKTSINYAAGTIAPKNDDTDVLMSFGVRYFSDSGVSGAIEYSTLLSRDNLDEDTISANVRWSF